VTGATAAARRCRIEGLLEGPVPPVADFGAYLDDWRARLAQQGVELVVNSEGGRFDVLAPELDLPVPEVGRDPAESLNAALVELVEKLPSAERARVHSTLRAVEYGGGTQRRTLFALRATGELVRVEDSAVGEPRALAEDRPSALHWTFWVGLALVAVVLVLAGPRLVERAGGGPPIDPAALVVDAAPGGYDLVALERAPDGGALFARLTRAEDHAVWLVADAGRTDGLAFRLAVERGRGALEWRDGGGALLRVDQLDLLPLAEAEEALVPVLEPPRGAVAARLAW
jgi:hypothetical protein